MISIHPVSNMLYTGYHCQKMYFWWPMITSQIWEEKRSLLHWIYLSEQVESLDKSRELYPYVFRKPILCLPALLKLFYFVCFDLKKKLFFCPIELINFLTNECTPQIVNFRILVHTIVHKRVNKAGLRLLSLEGPACKVGFWPVFGNLAFLTFPNGYVIFLTK